MAEQRQKELLGQQLNLNNGWESCIYDLFNPKNHLLGKEFFESTILSLSKYLDADNVFVARKNEKTQTLNTVAFCNREKIRPATSFKYKNTPCDLVINDNIITYKESVTCEFPESKILKELKVEGYCGVPLYNSSRKPIGVLTALFGKKIEDPKKVEALMFMFSSRISSELEHMEKEQELKKRNMELMVFREELINKNRELDEINRVLQKATLKAEESNKLKSSFLANLSHEVRTPMNAIIGFTELLKSNNLNPEERAEYINIVHQNGNQLMRVMDALIDISKLQTQVYVEPKEKINVNNLIHDLYKNYSQEITAMKKPIKLNLILGNEGEKNVLTTHKEALYKIFDHLINNAIKFTQEGDIYIGYTVDKSAFEFFIKDSGIGIPKGQEECIFDLFRQADIQNSREFGGNGIGLSIVKKYVEIMGGNVWAETNQEKGSLLKFVIPTA